MRQNDRVMYTGRAPALNSTWEITRLGEGILCCAALLGGASILASKHPAPQFPVPAGLRRSVTLKESGDIEFPGMDSTPLSHADTHRLRAAQGWLELGDQKSAAEELQQISPEFHEHPLVLMLTWHVHAKAENWAACVETGRQLTRVVPASPFGWVNLCNALYFVGRTQEAFDTLLPMLAKFPANELMPYNLACYASQLGRLDEARAYLDKAFALGNAKELKVKAQEDPDLKPLRDALGPIV